MWLMLTRFYRSFCSMFSVPQRMPSRSWATELIMRMTSDLFVGSQSEGVQYLRQQVDAAQLPSPYFSKVDFSNKVISDVPCLLTKTKQLSSTTTVIVYLHGGGYVCGSANSYKNITSALAYKSDCLIITPDYRLAPEHPVPAAHEDCLKVVTEVVEKYPHQRVVIVGDSAGGALAVYCAQQLKLKEHGPEQHPIASLVLLSPWVDPLAVGGTMETNQANDFLNKEFIQQSYQAAIQGATENEVCVNFTNTDLSMLPPTLIQYGGGELFFDQIQTFASQLKTQGVNVTTQNFPAQFHVFQIFAPLLNDANRAILNIVKFIRSNN